MSDITVYLIIVAVAAVIYAVAYTCHHYEYVVNSRSVGILKAIWKGAGIFAIVGLANAILELMPQGHDSHFGVWLLSGLLAVVPSTLAYVLLRYSCNKLWPVDPKDDRLIDYRDVPAMLRVVWNLVVVALELGFAIFFISPYVTGKAAIGDNPALAVVSFVISIACVVAAYRVLQRLFRK